jgi:tetratricopeptide (TPR) repeat protein
MGEVYAAYDPDLDRRVALKLIHPDLAARDERARERLLREARVTAKLAHPNIVVVHDVGEVDSRVFIAMEFVDGLTLSAWLAERPRPWREIVDVFVRAGRGLSAAHRAGIVHRDFKPQNVMVGTDGVVRVMDFGLARRLGAHEPATMPSPGGSQRDLALTQTGEQLGTPLYMAPEQLIGMPVDACSDQFSFCVSMYWALFGEHPFGATGRAETTSPSGEPPPLARKAGAPGRIQKALLRGLSVDPAARWPSLEALVAELQRDSGRQRRRFAMFGGVVLLCIAVAASATQVARRSRALCAAGPDRLAGVWEGPDRAGPSSRRARVKAAILASGTREPEQLWQRAASLLDRYAEKWVATYLDACEATHVRGDQSEEILDLRMTCLSDDLDSARALTQLLAAGDRAVIDHAVDAAGSLGDLSRCGAAEQARASVRPPRDSRLRVSVEDARRQLKEGLALALAGQSERATTIAAGIVARRDLASYCPLTVEAMLVEARASEVRTANRAVPLLEKTVDAAERCGHDRVVATALTELVFEYSIENWDTAERAAGLASAVLARIGGDRHTESWLANNIGGLRLRQGRFEDARREIQRSLEMKQELLSADHPDFAISMSNLGAVLVKLGRFDEALAATRRAGSILSKWESDDSDLALTALENEGEALLGLGRLGEAEAALQRALAGYNRTVANENPNRLETLSSLATLWVKRGDLARAIPVFEEVLATRQRSGEAPSEVAQAQLDLAVALNRAGRDRPRSLDLARRALTTFTAYPSFDVKQKEAEEFLAGCIPRQACKGRSGRS